MVPPLSVYRGMCSTPGERCADRMHRFTSKPRDLCLLHTHYQRREQNQRDACTLPEQISTCGSLARLSKRVPLRGGRHFRFLPAEVAFWKQLCPPIGVDALLSCGATRLSANPTQQKLHQQHPTTCRPTPLRQLNRPAPAASKRASCHFACWAPHTAASAPQTPM